MNKHNLSMLVDFYELTMANGYLLHEYSDKTVYFDMFFRRVPDGGGYAIFAGLEQVIEYLKNLEFTDEDIDYLRRKNIFSDKFLEYLTDFKFECDVWSVPEGTPVFPNEPIITVKGPAIQAQLIKSSESYCNKGKPYCTSSTRQTCYRIRFKKSTRRRRCCSGCEGCIYSRLLRNGMYYGGQRLLSSGVGNYGS